MNKKEVRDVVYASIESLTMVRDAIDDQLIHAKSDLSAMEEHDNTYCSDYAEINEIHDFLYVAADEISNAIKNLELSKNHIANI